MAKGSIVARVLPLRYFLFLLPNYTNISVFIVLFALFSDEPEVFLPKYSQTGILHAAHFQRITSEVDREIVNQFETKLAFPQVQTIITALKRISILESNLVSDTFFFCISDKSWHLERPVLS